MSVHLETLIQPNNILDWFLTGQSSNGLTVFETFPSQGIISLIFLKNGLFGTDCNLYFPIETLPKRLQSLGEKQHTTLKARFIANILSLSGTGNLNRLITVWWCIYTAHRTDRIECECWCFRKEPEPDVSRPQGSLTNINNNMSFSYRVLSSGRSRGADLLSILSDTFAYPNPPHKPAGTTSL